MFKDNTLSYMDLMDSSEEFDSCKPFHSSKLYFVRLCLTRCNYPNPISFIEIICPGLTLKMAL